MKEKGADLELADTAGSRPLHLAAFNGKYHLNA
jgi:ankyrin repeat protein